MSLNNVLGNCQPQPGTRLFAVTGTVNFIKTLKNPANLIGRNADAGVGDADLDPIFRQYLYSTDLPKLKIKTKYRGRNRSSYQ